MRFSRAFKTANTLRITLPRTIRHALNIKPGDILSLDCVRTGVVELRNTTTENEARKAGRKY